MSGTEIVASIIGVAGAGFRLSLILNAISCEVSNAPTEILAISKSVTLFSLLLKQTAGVLDRPGSVHSSEAVRVAEQVLEESNAVFGEINGMLDEVRSRKQDGTVSPSVPQRIRWCFKKHSIEYMLGRLDRLHMGLSLMLQIMELGSTMACTSRHDSPERVKEMSDKIRRERVEAQNVVVLYSFENQQLERLYHVAREESTEPLSPIEFHREESDALSLISTNDSQLTKVEEVPLFTKDMVVQPPKDVLQDFDDHWKQMAESKEDMLTASDQVVDKLLKEWTIWREKRDQELRKPRSKQNGRYRTAVDDVYDDEENSPFFDRYQDREDSPNSKLLEGTTTDWRIPHSVQAKLEKQRLRKTYAGYQPSVSAPTSDVEDSPSSTGSKNRPSRRHIIDSDEESSQEEFEHPREKTKEKPRDKPSHPRRRSSAIMMAGQEKPRAIEGPPMSKSYSAFSAQTSNRPGSSNGRQPTSPNWSQYQQQQQQQQQPPTSQQTQQHYQHRPLPNPDQNRNYHSVSSPVPNLHTQYQSGHPILPFAPGQRSPTSYLPPNQQMYPFPQPQTLSHPQPKGGPPRYTPHLSPQSTRPPQYPSRPKSRDGKPSRSPSRLSREYQRDAEFQYRQNEEEEKRQHQRYRKSKLGDNAAKGLLATGGLAIFLEALDAL